MASGSSFLRVAVSGWHLGVTGDVACGPCLIMQGRFNFLELGLHVFEIILFLKNFFMALHLLLSGGIYSDTGFARS